MCILPQSTIRDAMAAISRGAIGAAFIVNEKTRSFQSIVTDGDIRRAILRGGGDLETKLDFIKRPLSPTTAKAGMKPEEIRKMFGEIVRVIPVLDDRGRIVDVAVYDQRVHLPVAEPLLGDKEMEYVSDCIVSNWISSGGKYINLFEELFAQYCTSAHAVAVSNGTAALHLALLAVDVGPGDEVIVPSFTFISTANAVMYTGAKPIFVDSERETWNIDPKKIQEAITPKTKAIIPVHLYGHPADMDPILDIARIHNLSVIEDAAEAHGAEYKGRKVGSLGDIGIFSFFGNKIITTGEGGMVVTNSSAYAQKIRLFRDHGMSSTKRYWHPVLGYNYRMTNIQAAIGLAQTERVESIIEAKLVIAQRYHGQLKEIEGIVCPPKAEWARNVYWLYSILIEESFGISSEELINELKALGVETRPLFPPVHTQPIYNTGQQLSVAEELSAKGVSLPSSAGLQPYEIDRVCQAIKEIHQRIKPKVNV